MLKLFFASLSFILCCNFCNSAEFSPYKKALHELNGDSSFSIFDLGLSEEGLKIFEDVTITNPEHYTCWGDLPLLESELPPFFECIGHNDQELSSRAAEHIIKLVHDVRNATEQETACVVIRASTPNWYFKLPRWHTDESRDFNTPKFVATLKGPHTRFHDSNAADRENVKKNSLDPDTAGPNAVEANFLNFMELVSLLDSKKTIQPRRGQGAFFGVGNDRAAVHSTPDLTETRLFLSIVSGSERQIDEFHQTHETSKN